MKNIFILFVLSVIFWSSCSKDEQKTTSTPPPNVFAGEWSGTFSGDDSGSWSVTISDAGGVTGEALSDGLSGMSIPLTGTVDSKGIFYATYDVSGFKGTFDGVLDSTSAFGIWSNLTIAQNGNWVGQKQ